MLIFVQAALVQLGAKECVVCMGESAGDASKLKQVIARSGLLLTERKKGIWISRFPLQSESYFTSFSLVYSTVKSIATIIALHEVLNMIINRKW